MPSSALMDNNPYKRPEPMPMMDDPLPGETTFDSMRFGGGGGGGVDYLPQQQAVDDYSTSKEVQMMQQLQQPPPRVFTQKYMYNGKMENSMKKAINKN